MELGVNLFLQEHLLSVFVYLRTHEGRELFQYYFVLADFEFLLLHLQDEIFLVLQWDLQVCHRLLQASYPLLEVGRIHIHGAPRLGSRALVCTTILLRKDLLMYLDKVPVLPHNLIIQLGANEHGVPPLQVLQVPAPVVL